MEELRETLYVMILLKGLKNEEVLKLSEDLDILINGYYGVAEKKVS